MERERERGGGGGVIKREKDGVHGSFKERAPKDVGYRGRRMIRRKGKRRELCRAEPDNLGPNMRLKDGALTGGWDSAPKEFFFRSFYLCFQVYLHVIV